MKKVLVWVRDILIGIWIIVAIFTTVCLINYNEYKVTEFGNTTLLIIDSDELKPTYNKNDLVILTKESDGSYNKGDLIFFYKNNQNASDFISEAEIDEVIASSGAESSYNIDGINIPYKNIIGKVNGSKKMPYVGLILSIFESRWGFMFLVILPTLFALVYEIYAIVIEVKKETKEEKTEETKESN